MNPSLAYTVLAMQKAAQTPPANNNFLPMAGAGIGYMMGDGDMTDRLLPAGIGYFLANAYNNMTPEQRANLFAKSPELALQAQQASVGTIPEIAPGAAGSPDVHAKIRPEGLPANATLHHVQTAAVPGGAPAQTHSVWRLVGADGVPVLYDNAGNQLSRGSSLYQQAASQINSGKAPATYAALPQNVQQIPTSGSQNVFRTASGQLVEVENVPASGKKAQRTNFHYVDKNGARIGTVTDPSEYNKINKEFKNTQPAAPVQAPRTTPPKGFIDAGSGRGEWFNPKNGKVLVFDPTAGALQELKPGNPDYDRIRNAASGIGGGVVQMKNPLTGGNVIAVPSNTTPGVTGVSGESVNKYRIYEVDKTQPGWRGKEITNPYATQTINAELVADYNKPQTQSLTEEYRRLEATKPLPRDYAKAKLGDPESIAKINAHEQAVADVRTRDAWANKGSKNAQDIKIWGGGQLPSSPRAIIDPGKDTGTGRVFWNKDVYVKNPLRTVESRMNLGSNIGKATGAIGGFAGGAMLGGMAGKGIANALGGEDDQEFGAITGSILGGLAGGYGGFKGGERFIGRPLGDSLGQRGPGGTTNKLGETIDSRLLTKSKRFPVGRTLLGLGGAAIAANYFKDWLDKDFDKNETTPARAGIDLSRWMPR
jgi:hypothetical protein